MSFANQQYGMFTAAGNKRIHTIVKRAKAKRWTWGETYAALEKLARENYDKYGEATDTAVREYVYDAIGSEESFYC